MARIRMKTFNLRLYTNIYNMKHILFSILFLSSVIGFSQNTTFTRVIKNDSTDKTHAAFQSSSGDYFILSSTNSSGQGKTDIQVTKTNGLGTTQWSYTYGTAGNDVGTNMKPTTDGGAIICGYSDSLSGYGGENIFLTKINSSGAEQWTRNIQSDSIDRATDIIQSKSGEYYVTGFMKMDSLGYNTVVARYNSSGTPIWVKTFGGLGDDYGRAIIEDDLDRIVVLGSMANDSTNIGTTGDQDIHIMALSTTGSIIRSMNLGTTGNEEGTNIILGPNKTYYIGGNTTSGLGSANNCFIVSLDSNFSVLSSRWIGGVQDDRLSDIFLKNDGKILVATSSESSGSPRDALISEYNPSTGAIPVTFVIGGMDQDAISKVVIAGRESSGFTVLSSGKSLGSTNTEDIYITKLNSFLGGNCGYMNENINFGSLSLSTGVFGASQVYNIFGGASFTRNSITNNDTVLCCKLENRVIADSLKMCTGESLSLGRQAISGYVYNWSSVSGVSFSSTTANPSVSPSVSTRYKLVVSSSDGQCAPDSAYIYVNVRQRLNQTLISDTFVCIGDSVLINAPSGMNYYEWTTPSNKILKPELYVKITTPNITLYMLDSNSCVYRDTFSVEQKALPAFSLGPDTTICENLTITLTGPIGMTTYAWNGTISTANILTTNASRVHTLRVKNAFGCQFADSIQVLTNPNSPFNLGSDTMVCHGNNFALYGPTALKSYKWNNVSSTLPYKEISAAGTYWAEAYNSFGCPSYDTISISFFADASFNLGRDTNLCDAVNFQIQGPAVLKNYIWSDSSTSQNLTIDSVGTFWLIAEDNNGCRYRDTINITKTSSPIIDLGTVVKIPSSGLLTLTPGSSFKSYNWSTGATSTSIQVSDTGMYSVSVVDSNGCTAFAQIHITSTANIAYIDGTSFTIYPNPASDILYIRCSEASAARLILIDAQGKVVEEAEMIGLQSQLQISSFPAGLYRLVIAKEDKIINFSIIISH
jgi:hypothetical protein